MRPPLRSSAAAFLLAAIGLASVGPVSAQYTAATPFGPARRIIESFDLIGPVAVGQEVRFRLVGLPGGIARLDVPGIMHEWVLNETQPGVYESSYRLVPGNDPRAFYSAVATLYAGGQKVSTGVGRSGGVPPPFAGDRDRGGNRDGRRDARDDRDARPPEIADLSPGNGERVSDRGRVRIEARFADDRSGVDPASVRLYVDGRDVTGASRIDDKGIAWRDDLPRGRHSAELTLRDRAGNVARRNWVFDVVDSRPGNGWGDRNHDRDRRDNGRW